MNKNIVATRKGVKVTQFQRLKYLALWLIEKPCLILAYLATWPLAAVKREQRQMVKAYTEVYYYENDYAEKSRPTLH